MSKLVTMRRIVSSTQVDPIPVITKVAAITLQQAQEEIATNHREAA